MRIDEYTVLFAAIKLVIEKEDFACIGICYIGT